jgi:hypothetical protein
VAVKGSEVASDNYGVWMRQLRCQRQFWGFNGGDEFTSFRSSIDTTLNNLERWPLIERKVPGAMTLPEALAEASIALAIQRDYLQRYGEFARIPLPLLVLRWPDSVSYRVLLELQPLLSSRAMEVVEQTIARGLAVFIYYYPGLPIRLMSLGGAQGRRTPILVADTEVVQNIPSVGFGWTYARRADQMSGLIDVRGLIERWTDLFVKMLALGYLPKDPGSLLTADCLQPWNVVLDGGFVDIDSVVKIDALDDADLDDTIRRSLRGLVINIAYLMLGRIALAMDFRDRFPELTWTVLDDVRKRLEHEAATGGIPATLQRLVAPTCVHSDLDRLFRRATSASVDNGHE